MQDGAESWMASGIHVQLIDYISETIQLLKFNRLGTQLDSSYRTWNTNVETMKYVPQYTVKTTYKYE